MPPCVFPPPSLSSTHTSTRNTGYSVVQGPRTSMVRPHPAVWRLVHGVAVLYVMALVWLLFQTVHDARQALKVGGRSVAKVVVTRIRAGVAKSGLS